VAALARIAEVDRLGGRAIISVPVDAKARSESTVPEIHAPGDAILAFSRGPHCPQIIGLKYHCRRNPGMIGEISGLRCGVGRDWHACFGPG